MALKTTSEEFNERFSAWLRIEPRSRQDDVARGVQATVGDPAWFLARQWQTGELLGEDAASPIDVELNYSTQTMRTLDIADESELLTQGTPLELNVEVENARWDYRERVSVGQEFERLLRQHGTTSGLTAEQVTQLLALLRGPDSAGFPVPGPQIHTLDVRTQRFVRFMRIPFEGSAQQDKPRVVDGRRLVAGPVSTPDAALISTEDLNGLQATVAAWQESRCHRRRKGLPSAWEGNALRFAFGVSAGHESNDAEPDVVQGYRLSAPEYREGKLDWHSFSGPTGDDAQGLDEAWRAEPPVVAASPTKIGIAGTSSRWWEFEDAKTAWGEMDVSKPDLAKLLLMEFALAYGDDWYSIPVPMSVGQIAKIDSITVVDTFGDTTEVDSARRVAGSPADRFDMYSLSPVDDLTGPGLDDGGRPILCVPDRAVGLESLVVEEVLFVRDEGANMVWAIENRSLNGVGRSVSGADLQAERRRLKEEKDLNELLEGIAKLVEEIADVDIPEVEKEAKRRQLRTAKAQLEELAPASPSDISAEAAPEFRLMTAVPEHWIPFEPVAAGSSNDVWQCYAVQFRRAQMLRATQHAKWMNGELVPPEPVTASSSILELANDPLLWLDEESVQRSGIRIVTTKQRVRSHDGRTFVWLGRKVLTGSGERASGLRFDVVRGARQS